MPAPPCKKRRTYKNRAANFKVESQGMTPRLRRLLFAAALLLALLGACSEASSDALPLQDYGDPAGRYSFALPEGWQAETAADGTLTLTPDGKSGDLEALRVILFFAPAESEDVQTHVDQAQAALKPFLDLYLDDDYALVNQGEASVDKLPAVILDYAKPYNDSYLLARLEMVATPKAAVAFLGMGSEANWEPFVPTFRAMLAKFHEGRPDSPTGQP